MLEKYFNYNVPLGKSLLTLPGWRTKKKNPKKTTTKKHNATNKAQSIEQCHIRFTLLGASLDSSRAGSHVTHQKPLLQHWTCPRSFKQLPFHNIPSASFQTTFKIHGTYMSSPHRLGNILLKQSLIALEHLRSLFVEWVLWVGFQEKVLKAVHYGVDSQHRLPVFPETSHMYLPH